MHSTMIGQLPGTLQKQSCYVAKYLDIYVTILTIKILRMQGWKIFTSLPQKNVLQAPHSFN